MKNIIVEKNSNVLVGIDGFDDAGVYRLTDEIAIIQTVDFFTPIVDDPYTYGRIAACNALSDVYAMGGKPITAMNIVCFPAKKFSLSVLSDILAGGLDVLKKADVQLLGGHSIDDDEMKYGLSVTGIIHPDKILRNCGLKIGDAIVLTKPLGTGIISTAVKAGMAGEGALQGAIDSMTRLNDTPAEIMREFGPHACTDVTGFGLAGHLREMIASDKLEVTVYSDKLPILRGAEEAASMGMIPGGMYKNRDYIGRVCEIGPQVRREIADIAFDPQTSGGLLIAVKGEISEQFVSALKSAGMSYASAIGSVSESAEPRIRIV